MKLAQALLLLSSAIGAHACAWYDNCKCHDDVTGLQNDTVTDLACAEYQYGQGYYLENDHHSVWSSMSS
ncbi:extracellular protein 28-1 [Teratosphaeria destructans]|uniref:Extracellular protein 28-1 n=1 Tax=Teratosphaeria destructans TaxID=418781 RepID=A0A9W7VZ91_9PEZI|nr:extracellular protein 28-1 [Teratosphaeria destructans]